MFKIAHDLCVRAPAAKVFAAIATCAGLNAWWTDSCDGEARQGGVLRLGFGDGLFWRARIAEFDPHHAFALQMTEAADDWLDAVVSFNLNPDGDATTEVRFEHEGWAEQSSHYRRTSYCWASYLRLMRIYCETGAVTPYDRRNDA